MTRLVKIISVSVFFLALVFGGPAFANSYSEIDTAAAKALTEKDKNILIIFPLSKIEYDNVHIAGAVHIPMEELEKKLPADHNKPLIFYCIGEKSTASWRAASIAAKLGYLHVYAYREGLPAWVAAGYPTMSVEKLADGWVQKMTTEQLVAKLLNNGNVILLDCNLKADTEKLRVDSPKRVYIPLEELHTRYKELPKNKEIAVICLTGTRSPTAVRFLLAKGFPVVFSVDGGVQKWVAEKRPIIRNIGG